MDRPRLEQAVMMLSLYDNVQGKRRVKKIVFLWKAKGLCVHKGEVAKYWKVSHFCSGKSILHNILSKDSAINYMMKLIEIVEEWTFTYEELKASPDRHVIQEKVKKLQLIIWRCEADEKARI